MVDTQSVGEPKPDDGIASETASVAAKSEHSEDDTTSIKDDDANREETPVKPVFLTEATDSTSKPPTASGSTKPTDEGERLSPNAERTNSANPTPNWD